MSGFAEEIKQAQTTRAEAPPELPAGGKEAPGKDTAFFNSQAGTPEESAKTGADSAQVLEGDPSPAVPEAAQKIRIGTKLFDSTDAAVAYAQELELAKAQDEAFRQGVEAAKPKVEAAPVKTIDEIIEEKLFENPKQAIKELRESIIGEVKAAYEQAEHQKVQMAAQEATRNKVWTEFYSKNADLAGYEELVQGHFLNKNWKEVSNLPLNEGLEKLAEIARESLKISKVKAMPEKVLPNGAAVMMTGSGVTPQSAPVEEKAVDFITQMAKLRKR